MAESCLKLCRELGVAISIVQKDAPRGEGQGSALEGVASSAESGYPVHLRKKAQTGELRGMETGGKPGALTPRPFPYDSEGSSLARDFLVAVGDNPEAVARGTEPTAPSCRGQVAVGAGKFACRACLGEHFADGMNRAVNALSPGE